MTKKEAKKLNRLIARYTTCAIENSWRGSRCPEECDEIESDFENAGRALQELIKSLTVKQEQP